MLHLNIKKNEFFLFCIQIALIFFNFVTINMCKPNALRVTLNC